MFPTNRVFRKNLVAVAVAVVGTSFTARATNDTWNGGGGGFTDWSNPSNWAADTEPASGDSLIFAGTSFSTTTVNNISDPFSVTNLIQLAGAPGFTLTGDRLEVSGTIANYSTNPFSLGFSSFGQSVYINASNVEIDAVNGNILFPASAGSLYFNSSADTATFDAGAGDSVTIANNLTGSFNGGTIVANSGTLILSGSNGITGGATTVNNGAILQLQATANNTGAGTAYALGANNLTLNSGATVQLLSDSSASFFGGNNIQGLGNATINFNVNQLTSSGSNNTLTFAPAGFATFNTTINITGSNGYTLALGGITNGYGGPLTLNANSANLTIGAIGSSSSVSTLSVGGAANTTITGAISASSTVSKNGSGTLTLSAANSYSGPTNVNSGALVVSGSLTGVGTVSVSSGATLGGSGEILGAVSVATSGTLYPGVALTGSPVTLTLGGGLTFAGSANITLNLESSSASGIDKVKLTGGSLTLGSLDSLTVDLLAAPSTSTTYDFLYAAQNGNFLSTVSLTGAYASQYSAAIGYDSNNSAYDVTFAVIPEPGSWAMMFSGAGVLIGFRHMRRRKT